MDSCYGHRSMCFGNFPMIVNREAKSLSEVQDRLLKLKDEKLSKELLDKGVLIAEANERAAKADRKPAEAQLELAKSKHHIHWRMSRENALPGN
jgi:hypothetical protein